MYEHCDASSLVLNQISLLRQLAHDYLRLALARAGLPGLDPSHGNILGSLYQEDHLSMCRIAAHIRRRKSTLTVLADKLEKEGYIRRDASPDDGRVRQLSLTPRAEACRAAFAGINEVLQHGVWRGFSPRERELCMDMLFRMEANLRRMENESAAASTSSLEPDEAVADTEKEGEDQSEVKAPTADGAVARSVRPGVEAVPRTRTDLQKDEAHA